MQRRRRRTLLPLLRILDDPLDLHRHPLHRVVPQLASAGTGDADAEAAARGDGEDGGTCGTRSGGGLPRGGAALVCECGINLGVEIRGVGIVGDQLRELNPRDKLLVTCPTESAQPPPHTTEGRTLRHNPIIPRHPRNLLRLAPPLPLGDLCLPNLLLQLGIHPLLIHRISRSDTQQTREVGIGRRSGREAGRTARVERVHRLLHLHRLTKHSLRMLRLSTQSRERPPYSGKLRLVPLGLWKPFLHLSLRDARRHLRRVNPQIPPHLTFNLLERHRLPRSVREEFLFDLCEGSCGGERGSRGLGRSDLGCGGLECGAGRWSGPEALLLCRRFGRRG